MFCLEDVERGDTCLEGRNEGHDFAHEMYDSIVVTEYVTEHLVEMP